MAGRTIDRWLRVYADGYDLSGFSRSIGPLIRTYTEADMTCIPDTVKGVLPNHATLGIGTLNGVFDNTASNGLHVLMKGAGVMRTVMIPIGIQAAPAQGDPAYMGQFEQKDYMAETAEGVYATIPFDKSSVRGASLLYDQPWGWLLHAKAAETGVNAANGFADLFTPASTAFGGFMVYQVFAGNGTATLKVQDGTTAAGATTDITGMTSGVIDCATPKYGLVAIGRTATIRSYIRWQIVFGTATTVTFALALVRASN